MSSRIEVELSKAFIGSVNVRRDVGDITELIKSIQEKGILQPLVVRPSGNRYEVVVGARRFEAAKAIGLKTIPAIIRELTDEEAIAASLVENLQREDIEPEEEYDGLMALRKLNRKLYGTNEQLAKAIGKSTEHVNQVIQAVEIIRSLREEVKAKVSVKTAPAPEERKEGVLPLEHATLLHKVERAPTVQEIPKEKRIQKVAELAETIAPLPRRAAQKVVNHFIMNPEKQIEKIKEEAIYSHPIVLEASFEPRVAEALRKAAQDRGMTMERLIPIAVEEWLKQGGYIE